MLSTYSPLKNNISPENAWLVQMTFPLIILGEFILNNPLPRSFESQETWNPASNPGQPWPPPRWWTQVPNPTIPSDDASKDEGSSGVDSQPGSSDVTMDLGWCDYCDFCWKSSTSRCETFFWTSLETRERFFWGLFVLSYLAEKPIHRSPKKSRFGRRGREGANVGAFVVVDGVAWLWLLVFHIQKRDRMWPAWGFETWGIHIASYFLQLLLRHSTSSISVWRFGRLCWALVSYSFCGNVMWCFGSMASHSLTQTLGSWTCNGRHICHAWWCFSHF